MMAHCGRARTRRRQPNGVVAVALASERGPGVEYGRTGNHLRAHIAGRGEGGEEIVIPFEYERCP